MAWVWPRDIKAVRGGIYGQHGADFDDAIDRLTNMLHRRDWDAIERRWSKPRAVAYTDVAQCAKTLLALSPNPAFSAGVTAMTAALLPPYFCVRS